MTLINAGGGARGQCSNRPVSIKRRGFEVRVLINAPERRGRLLKVLRYIILNNYGNALSALDPSELIVLLS